MVAVSAKSRPRFAWGVRHHGSGFIADEAFDVRLELMH